MAGRADLFVHVGLWQRSGLIWPRILAYWRPGPGLTSMLAGRRFSSEIKDVNVLVDVLILRQTFTVVRCLLFATLTIVTHS